MADDLVARCQQLNLSEEERSVIGSVGPNEEENFAEQRVSLSLAGKLLSSSPAHLTNMRRVLKLIWKTSDDFSIKMPEPNLFVFQFLNEGDKKRVLAGRPWSFDDSLLLLQEVKGEQQPSEVEFSTSPFWVRIYDVPYVKRTPQLARDVGSLMEGFVEYDNSRPLKWEKSMRVRAMMDVNKPLIRGTSVAISPTLSKWVDFKYERLPDFCYFCGKLGHVDRDCALCQEVEQDEVVYKYGTWLRASPLKPVKYSATEIQEEAAFAEKLRVGVHKAPARSSNARTVNMGPISSMRKQLFASVESVKNVNDVATITENHELVGREEVSTIVASEVDNLVIHVGGKESVNSDIASVRASCAGKENILLTQTQHKEFQEVVPVPASAKKWKRTQRQGHETGGVPATTSPVKRKAVGVIKCDLEVKKNKNVALVAKAILDEEMAEAAVGEAQPRLAQ